jgi:phosphatidylserine/phosphatidylglycerophosphate/cardiolipin synthase-like enzyme
MSEPAIAPDRSVSHRRWPWWTIAVLTVALLVAAAGWWLRPGRTAPPPAPTSVADLPRAGETPALPVTGVFIEPGDGRAPLLDEIRAARRSIDLEVYIITDEVILRALEEAQQRGVNVRVILEEQPFGGGGGQEEIFARLEGTGIAVRWGNPVFRFTHIKMMVVDDAVAMIMNQNLTLSAFTSNREFGVVTNRPDAVRAAAAIFAADWTRGPEPDPGPLVVSPTNARGQLLALVDGSRVSLDLYAEVLRDPEMLDALGDAARRGVRVRVIVSPSADFAAEMEALAASGVDIRLSSSLYIHAKLIVADDKRAFVGSQNLSATSLDQNRELGIVVDDPVNLSRLTRTFAIDFRAATPLEAP